MKILLKTVKDMKILWFIFNLFYKYIVIIFLSLKFLGLAN